MSQHDFQVDDSDGASVRNDFIAALLALLSSNSGPSAPVPTFARMFWADTTAGVLRQRNAANSAWIDVGTLDAVGLGILDRITGSASFKQNNAVPNLVTIGEIQSFISTLTAGAEVGGLRLHSKIAGVLTKLLELEAIARLFGASAELILADNGAAEGPDWDLIRHSDSPTVNDLLAGIRWKYRDSGANLEIGAKIVATLLDPTNGSEDVALDIFTQVAGALASRMQLRNGLVMGGATGGDPGAGRINATGYLVNGAALGSGKLAQVARDTNATYSNSTTTIGNDNTLPGQSDGVEILSAAITPTNASSNIRIRAQVLVTHSAAGNPVIIAAFRDAVANAIGSGSECSGNANFAGMATLEVVVAAGSLTARTYKIRVGSGTAGTIGINGTTTARLYGGVAIANLEVEEILP